MAECSIDGCSNRGPFKRTWCGKHYRRWQRHGDPLYQKRAAPGEPEDFINHVALLHDGDGCLEWPFARFGNGYANIGGKSACQLICGLASGPRPTELHEVAHSCGRGHTGCVSAAHLRWALPKENQEDKKMHGTYYCGEQMPWAKLTEKQVREILASEGPHKVIAARFAVSEANVRLIRLRETWRHLTD